MSITAQFIPARNTITAISQAQNATVTTGSAHGYSIGAFVRLNIPITFGMQQANGAQTEVLSVPTDTTFTTSLNTTTFDAFAVPGSPKQVALVVPIGEFASYLASTKTNVLGGQPDGLIPPFS